MSQIGDETRRITVIRTPKKEELPAPPTRPKEPVREKERVPA